MFLLPIVMPGVSSANLLARPGEPLLEHLRGVAVLAKRWAPPELRESARLAGFLHDIYKATPWFQDYIRASAPEQNRLKATLGKKLHHALPSALFASFFAQTQGLPAAPIFLAVARHHGHLKTLSALLPDPYDPAHLKAPPSEKPYALLAEQSRALFEYPPVQDLLRELGLFDAFRAYLEKGPEQVATELRQHTTGEAAYWQTLTLFSLLIDADKHLAARVTPAPRVRLPADAAQRRVQGLPRKGRLAPYRDRLFAEVDQKARTLPLSQLFPAALTLTAPTGSGKTLALLNFALKLRNRLERERGLRPRIVYALPLVNLIEQNYQVFEEALTAAGVSKEAILSHHHLARIPEPEDDASSVEEKLFLAESWEAEVIVTTFVQAVETLYGTQNRMLKKLHRFLSGNILILDEVQALPGEAWPLVRRLLKAFAKKGNTLILATATQPRLLEGALELAPDFSGYPIRVRIQKAEGPPETPAKQSRLVVVNTIPRSLEVYETLKAPGERVYYLSTNLTPYDRTRRIEALKTLVPKTPLTLVATPIVEAGLDLDFAEGYRELGPVDSVIQVAGRINRSASRETETLYLIPDQGRASRVYGSILAHLARDFFSEIEEITDRALDQRLEEYFDSLEARISQAEAQGYLEALEKGRYCRPGYPAGCDCGPHHPAGCDVCCYRLIKDSVRRIPIFIEQDEAASEALACLEAALALSDPNARRRALRLLRPDLARYTISPAIERAAKNLPGPLLGREDYRLVRKDELEAYYDQETGFLWQKGLASQFL